MSHGGTILNFPGQESDEPILIFVRRYPVAFLPTLALIVVMVVFGLAVVSLLGIGGIIPYNFQIMIGSVFLLFMLLFTIVSFFDFYFDLNIVTDRRVVDIGFQGLFSRKVAQLLLEDIQDVDATTKGYLGTLLDFGDVEIQTAGVKPNFIFETVRHPNEISAIVLDLSSQARNGIAIADRHPRGPVAAIINDAMLPHTPDHTNETPENI
jgi:hypothetical protein